MSSRRNNLGSQEYAGEADGKKRLSPSPAIQSQWRHSSRLVFCACSHQNRPYRQNTFSPAMPTGPPEGTQSLCYLPPLWPFTGYFVSAASSYGYCVTNLYLPLAQRLIWRYFSNATLLHAYFHHRCLSRFDCQYAKEASRTDRGSGDVALSALNHSGPGTASITLPF